MRKKTKQPKTGERRTRMKKTAKRLLAAAAGASLVITPMSALAQEETTENILESVQELVENETELTENGDAYDPEGLTVTMTYGGNAMGEDADEIFSASSAVIRAGQSGNDLMENIVWNLPYGSFSYNWAIDTETGMLRFNVPETGDDMQYQINVQDILTNFVSGLTDKTGGSGIASHIDPEKAITTLTPYVEKIASFITEYTKAEEGQVKLSLLGETIDGSSATISLTGTGLANLMNDLALQIENDPDLKELLGDVADTMAENNKNAAAVTEQLGEQLGDEELAEEVFSAHADEEGIETVRALADVLPGILREGAGSLSEIGNFGLATITVGMDSEGKAVLADISILGGGSVDSADGSYIGFHYENHGGRLEMKLGMGTQELAFHATYDHGYGMASGQYTLDMDGSAILTGDYSFYPNENEEMSVLEIPYGSFSFDSEALGLDTDFFITAADDGSDDYQFFFTYADPTDTEADNISFWINLNAAKGAQLTAPTGTVQDITAYNAEQYSELFESIMEKVGEHLDLPEDMK